MFVVDAFEIDLTIFVCCHTYNFPFVVRFFTPLRDRHRRASSTVWTMSTSLTTHHSRCNTNSCCKLQLRRHRFHYTHHGIHEPTVKLLFLLFSTSIEPVVPSLLSSDGRSVFFMSTTKPLLTVWSETRAFHEGSLHKHQQHSLYHSCCLKVLRPLSRIREEDTLISTNS